MLERAERANSRSIEPVVPLAPVASARPALACAIDRLEATARGWKSRALAPDTDRWLLEVPDVGPACEVLLADQLFHDLTPAERDGLLAWIRRKQDPASGAWCGADGVADLSLTALGWWACVQSGDDPQNEPLVRALRVVHGLGGAQRACFQVRLWLAMAGAIPWSWLPAVPTELWLLPSSVALSPARISPWARGMLTPYLLIGHAPARLHLADPSALVLLRNDGKPVAPRLTRPGLAGDLLQAFDRGVKLVRKFPRGYLLDAAVNRAAAVLDSTQQHHGGWFSVRPTLLSLVALRVMGATDDDPRIKGGLGYLRRARGIVTTADGTDALAQGLGTTSIRSTTRLLQAVPDDDAVGWLLRQELCEPGPWQLRADTACGGWPIECDGRQHLDLEATCRALDALAGIEEHGAHADLAWAAIRRATDVLWGMQEADGSFGRFERGETTAPMRRLPWNDADLLACGEVGDLPHIRLSALALAQLGRKGFGLDDDRVARGLSWLEEWATPELATCDLETLTALAGCAAALCPRNHPFRVSIDRHLRGRQHEDGSFGPAVDTAQALRALLVLDGVCVQARRAARSLVATAGTVAGSPCNGHGLSPDCVDVSAPVTEALLALRSFAASVGTLAESTTR